MILGGTAAFMFLEGWTAIDALYYTVATITTVGYGDLAVTQSGSRLLSTFFMLSAVPYFVIGIGLVTEIIYGEHLARVIEHTVKKNK